MRGSTFDSAKDAKKAIRDIVTIYKAQYPQEYQLLKRAIDMQRQALADPKYAKSDRSGEGIRGLYEISETLQMMLAQGLTIDQTVWFKTVQGGRWFAKTYREFALPSDV